MDELEFRRRIYADPDGHDNDLCDAADGNESRQRFWQDTKTLNEQIKSAVEIPVPGDLADKLIWQATLREHEMHKRRSRIHIAMAASIAFVVGMTFTLWSPAKLDLGHAALAHMDYAQTEQPLAATRVSLEQVNAKLASMGTQLDDDIGDVYVANYCKLDSVTSLHLIIDSEHGPVSVFFTPHNRDADLPERFANDMYKGSGFSAQRANVMVVGNKHSDLGNMTKRVKASLNRA
jgi:hypothetical protein